MVDTNELADHVQENSDSSSTGETNVRMDSGTVSRAKSELGVSRNTELAPYIEALILDNLGYEDEAEDKVEDFKAQFEE